MTSQTRSEVKRSVGELEVQYGEGNGTKKPRRHGQYFKQSTEQEEKEPLILFDVLEPLVFNKAFWRWLDVRWVGRLSQISKTFRRGGVPAFDPLSSVGHKRFEKLIPAASAELRRFQDEFDLDADLKSHDSPELLLGQASTSNNIKFADRKPGVGGGGQDEVAWKKFALGAIIESAKAQLDAEAVVEVMRHSKCLDIQQAGCNALLTMISTVDGHEYQRLRREGAREVEAIDDTYVLVGSKKGGIKVVVDALRTWREALLLQE